MESDNCYPCFNTAEILAKYGITDAIEGYLDRLFKYNRNINLVSRETSREALRRVSADCLVPFEFTPPPVSGNNFFDIGSGGGFPSIILLLAFSGLDGVLYERIQKKAGFLIRALSDMNLPAKVRPADFIQNKESDDESFNFGFMKLVKLEQLILASVIESLEPGGRFIYYAPISELQGLDFGAIDARQYDYYLDDSKQLRSVSIFFKT